MHSAVWVALGGVTGSLARYYVGLAWAQRWGVAFPYGTLLINVSGCFVLGLVGTLAAERAPLVTPELRLLVGVGFCGAFTTFSTFGFEAIALVRSGAWAQAGLYVLASNALGLLGVGLGLVCARTLP